MHRNFFPLILVLFAGIYFFPAPASAESPRDALENSRRLTDREAIAVLEAGLASSGELRPYYLADLVRRYGESGDWSKTLETARRAEAENPSGGAADLMYWWHAFALGKSGRNSEAVDLARSRIDSGLVSDPALFLLWFQFAQSGTKAVLAAFDRTFPGIAKTDPRTWALSRYSAGLCAVREGDWACAEGAFASFAACPADLFPDFAPWGAYYRALCCYRLGKWADAVSGFQAYLDGYTGHANGWQAASTAALASMLAGSDPLPFAERAVTLAPTSANRASSQLLRASILFDRKEYSRAESILSGVSDGSTTGGLTPSAERAAFMLAEISVRLKRVSEAESRWLDIADRFPKSALAEDAVYRAAELRYLEGSWSRASELFTRYRQSWPAGRYLESALRSGGESLQKNGKADLAILWWEDLVKKFPSGISVPATLFDLTGAYREKGEYASAIRTSELYRSKYPSEAKADGVDRILAELAVLKKGGNAGTASLAADWKTQGMAETATGRATGVLLARRYLSDLATRGEAKAMLLAITAKVPAKKDSLTQEERSVFASAFGAYGEACREDADFRTASRALLEAGNLFAPLDGERSAEALYGAVDCFLQAGITSDAGTTAAFLESTWPDSVWTRRVRVLMEQ